MYCQAPWYRMPGLVKHSVLPRGANEGNCETSLDKFRTSIQFWTFEVKGGTLYPLETFVSDDYHRQGGSEETTMIFFYLGSCLLFLDCENVVWKRPL